MQMRSIIHRSAFFIVLLLSLLLGACSFSRPQEASPLPEISPFPSKTTSPSSSAPTPTADVSQKPADSTPTEVSKDLSQEVDQLLSALTLEQKIGQMFFITSRFRSSGEPRLLMDATLEDTLKRFQPGGFILFSENLKDIEQTVSFIKAIKEASEIPIFIGIDEEGGVVTRLNKAPQLHSTLMPEPYTIGRTKNSAYAYEASYAIGEEIRSLGFNLNFAPVADVFSNPKNKIIGKRAYSSDAETAAVMTYEAVKGAQDCGIIPVLKHFPGHGDTEQDSHTGSAVAEKSLEELEKEEFIPFKAGIDAGVDMVMTAHVLTPNLTDNNLPATLSKPVLKDLLRDQLGFEGIIITDGLEMSAISAFYPEEEAVVLAVEAGVDMLLLPKDLAKAYDAILSAVKNGRLSEERINESVRRILSVKNKRMIGNNTDPLDPEVTLGSQKHLDLAESIRKDSHP